MNKVWTVAWTLYLTLSLSAATDLKNIVDSNGHTYWVGYDKIGSGNEDCYIRYLNTLGVQQWKVYLETSTQVNCRGVWIDLDPQEKPIVLFSVDGHDSTNDITDHSTISDAFSNAIFSEYGRGNGVTISVLAEIDPVSKMIVKGTYLRAEKENGDVNTMKPIKVEYCKSGDILVQVESASSPPAAGSSSNSFIPNSETISQPSKTWDTYLRISRSLDKILDSQVNKKLTCSSHRIRLLICILFIFLILLIFG